MDILMGLAIVAIIFVFFYYYGKFIGNLLIKKEKKRIDQKNPTDAEVQKFYKNYNPANAFVFFLFGIIPYFPIKAAYEEIRRLYEAEAKRRGLALPK